MQVRKAVVATALLWLGVSGCGDGTGPSNRPGVRIISGASAVDTIDGAPRVLELEVRAADGTPATGVPVTFTPPRDTLRPTLPTVALCPVQFSCFGGAWAEFTANTDASGRLRVVMQPGAVSGRHTIQITVPSLGYSASALFAVGSGGAVRVAALAGRQGIVLGESVTLAGAILDRYGNALVERPALTVVGDGSVITFDAISGAARAVDIGNVTVNARAGSLSSTISLAVVPRGRLVVSTPTAELWALNTDGSQLRRIASVTGPNNDVTPVLSTTQSAVLYSSNMDIVKYSEFVLAIIDTSGGNRRVLRKEFGFNQPLAARLLPDGSLLVIGSGPGFYFGDWTVMRIGADNSITRLATITDAAGGSSVVADFSPDGTQIVYCSAAPIGVPSIKVYDIATRAVRVLTSGCSSPRWSPDGRRIAFLDDTGLAQPGFAGRVVVINADGTGRRTVGTRRVGPGVSWSLDGEYVVSQTPELGPVWFTRVSDGKEVQANYAAPDGTPAVYARPYVR